MIPKQRPYDIQLIDAFCKGAYGELDYEHEAANQRRFKDAISSGPASLRDVYVPEVRLATRRVLITDWVEGERLSQASQPTIKRLVPLGVELFCWQLLDLGFYHCDPHPGNLLVDKRGRLCVIDFGSTRRPCAFDVTPSPRRALHAIAVTRRHAQVSAPRSRHRLAKT
jgi:predicted unusual protein kinase regulating ubiquinone biosynthesis (AarF/ABC1/UbiB family)